MRSIALAFALTLSTGTASAADGKGNFQILGAGTVQCSSFPGATPQQRLYVETWLAGYITALNRTMPDTYNLIGNVPIERVMSMIGEWCSQTPDARLAEVIHRIAVTAHANRVRQAPN
jgi:hypothetical protein